ncbi:hypothetical protein [Microbacterium sp. SA39]|nr:hypothetical protein [Microbacterium sp. SA39]KJQ54430.1 hypothetical protein RS85_01582 [Microbacterium sp. SA39]
MSAAREARGGTRRLGAIVMASALVTLILAGTDQGRVAQADVDAGDG